MICQPVWNRWVTIGHQITDILIQCLMPSVTDEMLDLLKYLLHFNISWLEYLNVNGLSRSLEDVHVPQRRNSNDLYFSIPQLTLMVPRITSNSRFFLCYHHEFDVCALNKLSWQLLDGLPSNLIHPFMFPSGFIVIIQVIPYLQLAITTRTPE